jgi:D-serine deaminase-like pyridoxal phosphate-dependent protein
MPESFEPRRFSMECPLRASVDEAILTANINRLHELAASHGVAVRSHTKGHRTVEIARRQVEAGAIGIAVQYAAEGEVYADAGINDILIVHPWNEPWRWKLMASLARRCNLSVFVKDAKTVRGLGQVADAAGCVIGARILVENRSDTCGEDIDEIVRIAGLVERTPGLKFDGISAYRGIESESEAPHRVEIGGRTATHLVSVAKTLRTAGIEGPICVSVGGTPTAEGALGIPGVTEICAGAYALQDAGMAAIGVCTPEQIAVSVVPTESGELGEAARIMSLYPYPWQRSADIVAPSRGSAPLPPIHICALAMEVPEFTVHLVDGSAERWNLRYLQDTQR